jgi:hypothetical protein
MRLRIIDPKWNNQILIDDITNIPIPRLGEKVQFGYSPLPKVVDIGYDYQVGEVIVITE